MVDEKVLGQGLESQAKALREFGYPDITKDDVRKRWEKWRKNEEQLDVIGLFCKDAFEEHPDIFGEQEEEEID